MAAANAAAEQAKQQLINAAKTLAKIAMEELGITAALDCFTNGDLGSCAETALNIAASFVGGLAGKLVAKYGAPWKWRKGAAVAKRVWNVLGDLTSGVKNWWNNSRLAQRLAQGNIVSDVWLYNRGSAPEVAPWKSGAQMPFQNPAEYVTEESVVHELSPDSLSVSWSGGDESHPEAIVRIGNRPIAWLAPEAKPGWSALVKRNGPLARGPCS